MNTDTIICTYCGNGGMTAEMIDPETASCLHCGGRARLSYKGVIMTVRPVPTVEDVAEQLEDLKAGAKKLRPPQSGAFICPPVAAIAEGADIGEVSARVIRQLWKLPEDWETFEEWAEKLAPAAWGNMHRIFFSSLRRIGAHELKKYMIDWEAELMGVEHLGWHKRRRCMVDYCNAGDTYEPTILFFGNRLEVGDWGSVVESGQLDNEHC